MCIPPYTFMLSTYTLFHAVSPLFCTKARSSAFGNLLWAVFTFMMQNRSFYLRRMTVLKDPNHASATTIFPVPKYSFVSRIVVDADAPYCLCHSFVSMSSLRPWISHFRRSPEEPQQSVFNRKPKLVGFLGI